jgi:hypothetical protein
MLAIGIDTHHHVAFGQIQTCRECRLLAEIPRQPDQPCRQALGNRGMHDHRGLVGAAVVHHDQLKCFGLILQRLLQRWQEHGQVGRLVICRHHHRQQFNLVAARTQRGSLNLQTAVTHVWDGFDLFGPVSIERTRRVVDNGATACA